jgi:hypothetical protein
MAPRDGRHSADVGRTTASVAGRKPVHAFVTACKGICYLTVKHFGRHHHMLRIRAYKIEPDEKRHMRRLYPEAAFDWKRITEQLAEKREDCRRYRTRGKRTARRVAWEDGPPFAVYEPGTRTIYTNGVPSTAAGVGRLLDAVLRLDRELTEAPLAPESARRLAEPGVAADQTSKPAKPR